MALLLMAACALFLTAACGSDSRPNPTSTPQGLLVDEVLSRAESRMVELSSARFTMVDEGETGAKFFGMTFQKLEGEVKAPDSFKISVESVSPLGFINIQLVSGGGQADIRDFFNKDKWNPLEAADLPFNFGDLGQTLSDIIPLIQGPAITGVETVGGVESVRIVGTVMSQGLSGLVTTVDFGFPVKLTVWIDQEEYLLRQIRIEGRIYEEDTPEIVRVLTIDGFDEPVDIQLPDDTPGS